MLVKGALLFAAACLIGGVITWKLAAHERIIMTGSFHSVAHKGAGRAVIAERRGGIRVLHLIQAKTYPAKDLEVCLAAAPDAEDNETVRNAGFRCLGSFGPASFELPREIDLNMYRSVVLWSRSYGVNFTTAPLTN